MPTPALTDLQRIELGFPAAAMLHVLDHAADPAAPRVRQVRLVLETMAARIIDPASITMALLGRGLDAGGIAADPILSEQLRGAVTALVLASQSSRVSSV